MSDIAIKVEDLGKLYRLGEIGTGTISHDLNRWFARIRGKEDPFAKIGESNDRTSKSKGNSDYVWALQDINFEIKKGEAVGIIGRNGAGKSTLLKLLSKVTQPSSGQIKIDGRIASLLEVGTGFHPEMTGRENVFLNGAIMGMTKKEIKRKFDEIVDFAGVDRYIDTPVKRYSSGMYVRLAFAVAAHLESEILIVDEVLAVGDAEFQKKCLGKMGDVTKGEGRTVLFVSHNMGAIQALTNESVFLNNGKLEKYGTTDNVIKYYLDFTNKQLSSHSSEEVLEQFRRPDCKDSNIKIRKILINKHNIVMAPLKMESEVVIEFEIEITKFEEAFHFAIIIFNQDGVRCQTIYSREDNFVIESLSNGKRKVAVEIPSIYYCPGKYFATIQINPMTFSRTSIDCIVEYPLFEIVHQPKSEFEINRGYGVINQKNITWKLM